MPRRDKAKQPAVYIGAATGVGDTKANKPRCICNQLQKRGREKESGRMQYVHLT